MPVFRQGFRLVAKRAHGRNQQGVDGEKPKHYPKEQVQREFPVNR